MTSLRRFLGLPRFPARIYLLILALLLLIAYFVSGPMLQFYHKLYFSVAPYEPRDRERQEHISTFGQE
jgi:hypothetical protein